MFCWDIMSRYVFEVLLSAKQNPDFCVLKEYHSMHRQDKHIKAIVKVSKKVSKLLCQDTVPHIVNVNWQPFGIVSVIQGKETGCTG